MIASATQMLHAALWADEYDNAANGGYNVAGLPNAAGGQDWCAHVPLPIPAATTARIERWWADIKPDLRQWLELAGEKYVGRAVLQAMGHGVSIDDDDDGPEFKYELPSLEDCSYSGVVQQDGTLDWENAWLP